MLAELQQFIDNYGYVAVFLGTLFEGETILLLGGLAAQFGYLELPWVIAVAFVGSLSGDQFWFFIGRRHGNTLLRRFPTWQRRVEKVHSVLRIYETPVLLGFRFFYGFRNLTPFVVGMGRISTSKFILLNAIGAITWSVTIACAGYLFGQAVELVLGDIKRYQIWTIVCVLIIGVAVWLVHIIRGKRRGRALRQRIEAPGATAAPTAGAPALTRPRADGRPR
jgi:membrane protein DedA with SNARE-associated domain